MVKELAPQSRDGTYARPGYSFRERIGAPGFPAESQRYHLYLGNACPWCHRVLLVLAVRGLSSHVSWTLAQDDPERATRGGWVFDSPEPVWGAKDLWEVYDSCSPGFRGRCTAPLLVDRKLKRAVSNESADILEMLNSLQLPGSTQVDLRPAQLLLQIEELNNMIYEEVNNGVYKSGFSTSQAAYDAAQQRLYAALDSLEARLASSRFLLGDRHAVACPLLTRVTEPDIRLLPTVVRFDAMYATLFRCSRRRIADYPHLSAWLRDMWQLQLPQGGLQVRDTVDLDDARRSYFTQLFPLNPSGIVPSGPTLSDLDLDHPAGRGGAALEDAFHLRPPQTPPAVVSGTRSSASSSSSSSSGS